MKIKRRDLIKYIIIGIVILVVFGIIIALLGKNKDDSKINLNDVSDNYRVEDDIAMILYERFNPERDFLFNLIGSNGSKDYYGYYYKKDKLVYKDLDDVVKNTILINDADYTTGIYDENNNCYHMSLVNFNVIYGKIFGSYDYKLNFDKNYQMKVNVLDDSICISNIDGSSYDKVIDTYMVNVVNEDEYIRIYERVAFIKLGEKYLYFYKDYKMKDLVYKLKVSDELDQSFINNKDIVSNVLLKYQDKFDLYEYTYIKGVDSYYFESIER